MSFENNKSIPMFRHTVENKCFVSNNLIWLYMSISLISKDTCTTITHWKYTYKNSNNNSNRYRYI